MLRRSEHILRKWKSNSLKYSFNPFHVCIFGRQFGVYEIFDPNICVVHYSIASYQKHTPSHVFDRIDTVAWQETQKLSHRRMLPMPMPMPKWQRYHMRVHFCFKGIERALFVMISNNKITRIFTHFVVCVFFVVAVVVVRVCTRGKKALNGKMKRRESHTRLAVARVPRA